VSQGQWIGPRPTGLQIGIIFFVGIIGILIPGVQPVVLAALLAEHHIDLTQMGHAASVELLTMGAAAALAAAFLPPRRLPAIALITSLVMAAGNWATPFAMGEMVTLLRALTGFTGGILIWVVASAIARSATPERWAGIYLTVQTLTQLFFATGMSLWVEPKWGAMGDFGLLAWASIVSAVAALLLPSSFVPLPKPEGARSGVGGLPPPLGVAGLVVNFLLMMFIVSIWVYYDPIAHEAGLSTKVSETAVSLSLGSQVLGGTAAVVFASRVRWYPALLICALVDLAMVWILGMRPSAVLFLVDAAIFGFIWIFILPFMVPMLIEADPSRRSAVLTSGVGLLGGSLGPTMAAMLISPENTRGALWLGAGCLVVCFLIATALRMVIKPHPQSA
jgi:hypothetical protein